MNAFQWIAWAVVSQSGEVASKNLAARPGLVPVVPFRTFVATRRDDSALFGKGDDRIVQRYADASTDETQRVGAGDNEIAEGVDATVAKTNGALNFDFGFCGQQGQWNDRGVGAAQRPGEV